MAKRGYQTPIVEIYSAMVEHGFQNSLEDPGVAESIPW